MAGTKLQTFLIPKPVRWPGSSQTPQCLWMAWAWGTCGPGHSRVWRGSQVLAAGPWALLTLMCLHHLRDDSFP